MTSNKISSLIPKVVNEIEQLAQRNGLDNREQKVRDQPLGDTDIANSRRLAKQYGEVIRFTPERGWYAFDGRRWAHDEKQVRVQALAKLTAESIFDEVKNSADRDVAYRHAKRSQSRQAIDAMIWLARSEPGIAASLNSFDAHPWLFNVANGTLNLKTGALQQHERNDLITAITDVAFDPTATCSQWEAFLHRVLAGDDALCAYVRRFVGYLLAGDVRDQSLHFLYGNGANGKSTFCEVLFRLLGDYAVIASPDLIVMKRHASIPNDVARLRGVRAAIMNETRQGTRFDEAKLKDLTGGDALTARFLHQEFFDFLPTHRLVIRGNHKPGIVGTDEGIWRRLRLLPFTVEIPVAERDDALAKKIIEHELPGILNWALQGSLEWQCAGMNPPTVVTDAVKAYRQESDTLGRFLDEYCEINARGFIASSTLMASYKKYCDLHSEQCISAKDLCEEMESRGFPRKKTDKCNGFRGLRLRRIQP